MLKSAILKNCSLTKESHKHTTTKEITMYTVKNVKTFRGHDGNGFNATLYENGKRVALVDDDGWGGGYNYQWLDPSAEQRLNDFAAASAPVEVNSGGGNIHSFIPTADCIVGKQVDLYLTLNDMKKKMKRKIYFNYPGSYEIYQIDLKPAPDVFDELKTMSEYDGCTFLNLLPEDQAFGIWRRNA